MTLEWRLKVALKDALNIKKTCHFHQVILSTACYIKKGYNKAPSNPS